MVIGLVPSMVRCKGRAILSWWEDWFLPWNMWVLSHSEVIVGCVPTWSDISTECHSLGEWRHLFSYQEFVQSGTDTQLGVGILSDMMCEENFPIMVRCKGRAILSWWKDWFLPCQIWVLSHSDVTVGLVPTWSDISVECRSWNGGTWSVTKNTQPGTERHYDK